MKNQFDYFHYEWFFHNEDNILGKDVDKLYRDYQKKSYNAGHRPYCKKHLLKK